MVCDSCGAQRNVLTTKKSEIYKLMVFSFCHSCTEKNMEPRWLIILAARAGKDVSFWLEERRYEGEDILGKDLE
ncbi:hypothetical protein HUN41_00246 [Streptomyces phage Coruscant]|uniref:Uncharacterized protein n=1 Tax=Streptomyces phage Coruscant TaxID=2739834 RepID=A0A7G4AWE5_9CAUD|nr:hypothetical protein PP454_gp082 [Streptomyces phage Coruscant]QMP84335.1 hypothetical protein HUN41_00246 [Streptomyces phage Coruscant]